MAGILKPSEVINSEATFVVNSAQLSDPTGFNLLNGVNETGSSIGKNQIYNETDYVDVTVSEQFNLWCLVYESYGWVGNQHLKVERWNGTTWEQTSYSDKGPTEVRYLGQWHKQFENIPAGRYRFSLDGQVVQQGRVDSEWFFEVSYLTPPVEENGSRVLLVVTMVDDDQKEYELSRTQINDFLNWYNTRDAGSGSPYYVFNKDFNVGPFISRKDHLVFNKIQDFEIMEFTK